VEPHVFGGTAPCDGFGDLAGLASRPPAERPALAVIEFGGNAFTPCMQPGAAMPSDSDIVAAYQRDGTTFITTLLAAGIRPVFALAPAVDHQSLIPEVNAPWRSLASQFPGVDAGVLVDASDGTFTRTMPCGSWEGLAAGCDAGVIAVRAPDGTHFCPTETLTWRSRRRPSPDPVRRVARTGRESPRSRPSTRSRRGRCRRACPGRVPLRS
jgi:hypothetical protein